ncbi:hypothetical protein N1851_030248 [Merluccius polli]|uniref:DDE Tnp4 domain-containing protein n=1 Tax=Merluccius polli TaxID=89951 RepID=A0AA47M5T5_MERPO|nr:hypothetical protein N1851_030248 [Merluccius polli]
MAWSRGIEATRKRPVNKHRLPCNAKREDTRNRKNAPTRDEHKNSSPIDDDGDTSAQEDRDQTADHSYCQEDTVYAESGEACSNEACQTTVGRLTEDCNALRLEVYHLREMVRKLSFSQESFKDNDDMVQDLTGLPSYPKLMVVFTFVSSSRAHAQTYSQYKHHNTAKFLISITPHGVISFVSYGWGGRGSDRHITENSKYLENLVPGDLVLADRGFTVADSVGLYSAQLKIPAFTRGKQQLHPNEVEYSRGLSAVRIHVERVIGLVRNKYTILQSTIPISLCQTATPGEPTSLDKMVRVCCALRNICPSVVPSE